ncbi:MAG: protein translocase subunit SecF [Acidobacteria bacterium]|nr:MAG: protein translocase subunit SecF [Acidobacteriota bacterium]PYQ64563.1 MAG: protein translocase subunit SecF [Acidobacteriota bacterium]
MELFRQTNIDFLRYKWIAIGASWLMIALGLFAIFVQKGLKFGIDFAGGTQIAVRFTQRPDLDHLRKVLDAANLGDTGIQRYEDPSKNEVLIRVQQQKREGRDVSHDVQDALRSGLAPPGAAPSKLDLNREGRDSLGGRLTAADPDHVSGRPDVVPADYYGKIAERIIAYRSAAGIFRSTADFDRLPDVSATVKSWLKANCFAGPFVLLSAENVGPQVGADLRKKALLAVVWSIGGMLAYIAIRFRSFPFGVGAVVALIHDTLITVGLLALMGREFNLVVVAALLTLVGYSVNDTVVVYDRVRENQRTPKKEALESVINRSINQTLSRTVLTSGATMLVCVALFFLGGEVLNTFALALIIGIIVGTYSSIYVAAAIVVIWKDLRTRRKLQVVPAIRPAPPPPPAAARKKKSGRR